MISVPIFGVVKKMVASKTASTVNKINLAFCALHP